MRVKAQDADGHGNGERGQVVVLLAVLLPVLFGLGAIVIDVGTWYVTGKQKHADDRGLLSSFESSIVGYQVNVNGNGFNMVGKSEQPAEIRLALTE